MLVYNFKACHVSSCPEGTSFVFMRPFDDKKGLVKSYLERPHMLSFTAVRRNKCYVERLCQLALWSHDSAMTRANEIPFPHGEKDQHYHSRKVEQRKSKANVVVSGLCTNHVQRDSDWETIGKATGKSPDLSMVENTLHI
jgi:hypothetical protein